MRQLAYIAALLVYLTPPAAYAQPQEWLERSARAVVQVTFEACVIQPCRAGISTGLSRSASGFLFRLPDGTVGILTALHAVCGDGTTRYRFGSIPGGGEGTAPQETAAVLAHAGHDLAFLRLARPPPSSVAPLDAAYDADTRGLQATLLGYAERAPMVLDSQAELRSLARRLTDILNAELQDRLRRLGFPDLTQRVIVVQNAIAPGNSGAPLLDRNGRVVGVANGGVPTSGTYISWAIPIDAVRALRPAADVMPQLACTGTDAAQRSSEVDRMFYIDQLLADDRPLSRGVIEAHLVLRLRSEVEPLRQYASWLRAQAGYSPPRDPNASFGAAQIGWNDRLSPRNLPAPEGTQILDTLARLRVRLACFDATTAADVQAGAGPANDRALLVAEVPLGPLEPGNGQPGVVLSLSDNFGLLLNLYRASWITLDPYVPGTRLERRFSSAAQLLGGSCRVDLGERRAALSWTEAAMLDGVLRLSLRLSERATLTMLTPALLPAGAHGERWEIWGQLPLRPDPPGVDPMAFVMWR